MKGLTRLLWPSAALLAAAAAGACAAAARPPLVQPGAPGGETRTIDVVDAVDVSRVAHTPADVRFMQNMIGHHAQALEMTALVPSRSSRDELRLLARRIELSQSDEINFMREWLAARGEPLAGAHGEHDHRGLMPGMLSPEEMHRLAAATGDEFERLFLEAMIRHHQGALAMVEELFATPGAGQEPEIFAFASEIEADQRLEIDRMLRMLAERRR